MRMYDKMGVELYIASSGINDNVLFITSEYDENGDCDECTLFEIDKQQSMQLINYLKNKFNI